MKKNEIEHILNSRILPFVNKPGRYIGKEINHVKKAPRDGQIRFALAFPEVYEIAMSYMGYDILYHVLNSKEDIFAERVYAPWGDMEELIRKERLPLYSLETFTPINEFDLVGFSLQYELTYTNVLNMLDLANIPIWAKNRTEEHPIILAGGPCSCNPEPMVEFFDAFLIGDGEEAVIEICEVVREGKKQGLSRNTLLDNLSRIRGIYVPAFYQPIYHQDKFESLKKEVATAPDRILTRITPQLDAKYYPKNPLVPLIEVTHDRFPVEVMRGCTEGCRYCNAGMIYRPVRERDHKEVVEQISAGITNSGFTEVSFVSLSISDYSQLSALIAEEKNTLGEMNINVSLPSMRLDSFSSEIAEFVSSVRKSGFTFAPEAGSERLRKVINKNINNQDLFRSVEIALQNGWKLLKFYFMIGLPTETEEDIRAIAELMNEVVNIGKRYGKIRYHVSISPFSPKAHTPFQWERQNSKEELLEKIGLLQNNFARIRQAKLRWRDPEVSLIECVLGRGDRRFAQVIWQAWRDGALFDGWSDHFRFDLWLSAFEKSGLSLEPYRESYPVGQPLPWDHIDKGITKSFLQKERENARREITVADCKAGACHACGIQRKQAFAEFTQCYFPQKGAGEFMSNNTPNQSASDGKQAMSIPDSNPPSRYCRVQFTKSDYARYLSHLDVVRSMERACRRAQIPLLYSQGFNPHPKMSFAQPLSLGHTSEAEYVDLEIALWYDEDLPERLNPHLPEGIRLLGVKWFDRKPVALAQSINSVKYLIKTAGLPLNGKAFEQSLMRLLEAESINISRTVKGREKTINIRPFIDSIIKQNRSLEINTRYIEKRTVRLNELLHELFGNQSFNARTVPVHRAGQYILSGGQKISPLDISS